MNNVFYIAEAGNQVHSNCLAEMKAWLDSGAVKVTFSRSKMTRSQRQNRTMHQWFADIDSQSGEGLIDVAGRCKLNYFVPVILADESEKTQGFRDLWAVIEGKYSYEQKVAMLGQSVINSTSLLSTKAFATALTEMRMREPYILRDPELMGLSI